MKRVLLHGYTAANLGDDLFFRVIVNRYPNVQFVLPTLRADDKVNFSDVKNIKVVDFCKISNITSHKIYMLPKLYSELTMKQYDAVVCIGGSLFIDRENPSKNDRIEIENFSFIADWECAYKKKVPYFILGANWGPCFNQYFYDYFNNAFDHVHDIYFRDLESYSIFQSKKNVRTGADILLGSNDIRNYVNNATKKKQVAISVINPSKKVNDKLSTVYYSKIGEITNRLISYNYDVLLMSFCCAEGDEEAVKKVLKKVNNSERVKTIFYRSNAKAILTSIAESEMVVASRFHATILAWTLGVPTYSIAYSNKISALLNDFCVMDSGCKIENIADVSTDSVISKATFPNIKEKVQTSRPFEKLDEIIEV